MEIDFVRAFLNAVFVERSDALADDLGGLKRIGAASLQEDGDLPLCVPKGLNSLIGRKNALLDQSVDSRVPGRAKGHSARRL